LRLTKNNSLFLCDLCGSVAYFLISSSDFGQTMIGGVSIEGNYHEFGGGWSWYGGFGYRGVIVEE
jgi:hypothetical protein